MRTSTPCKQWAFAVEYGDAIRTRQCDLGKIGLGRVVFMTYDAAERFQRSHGPEEGAIREVVINTSTGCIDWTETERNEDLDDSEGGK